MKSCVDSGGQLETGQGVGLQPGQLEVNEGIGVGDLHVAEPESADRIKFDLVPHRPQLRCVGASRLRRVGHRNKWAGHCQRQINLSQRRAGTAVEHRVGAVVGAEIKRGIATKGGVLGHQHREQLALTGIKPGPPQVNPKIVADASADDRRPGPLCFPFEGRHHRLHDGSRGRGAGKYGHRLWGSAGGDRRDDEFDGDPGAVGHRAARHAGDGAGRIIDGNVAVEAVNRCRGGRIVHDDCAGRELGRHLRRCLARELHGNPLGKVVGEP